MQSNVADQRTNLKKSRPRICSGELHFYRAKKDGRWIFPDMLNSSFAPAFVSCII